MEPRWCDAGPKAPKPAPDDWSRSTAWPPGNDPDAHDAVRAATCLEHLDESRGTCTQIIVSRFGSTANSRLHTSRACAQRRAGFGLRGDLCDRDRYRDLHLERELTMSIPRNHRTASVQPRTTRRRPTLEVLEQRLQLSTFRVNTTLDTVAVTSENGKDSTGHISLRSAIMAADARGGSSSINVPAGTFTLSIPGANEDASATGDLDLKGKITIKGEGSARPLSDANQIDRVFQVLGGTVSISKLTIQNGRASQGAGILNAGGNVSLSSVLIQNNVAQGATGQTGASGSGGGPPAAMAQVVQAEAWQGGGGSSMPPAR